MPEPNPTPSEFEKLLAGLARHGVDFANVGGIAVILNGYPRATTDLDDRRSINPQRVQHRLDPRHLVGAEQPSLA